MAITVTQTGSLGGVGSSFIKFGTFNTGTQATGGVAVTPGDFKLSSIDVLLFTSVSGYVCSYISSTAKVATYQSAGSAAALADVGATDLSAVNFQYIAIGKS